MNTSYRKRLPGTALDYFDTRAAVDAIEPGAYAGLPYTSRVHAENLVRRCDPATLTESLRQLIERKRDLDFPWFPARVVCHDILGQTALVDLAGLREMYRVLRPGGKIVLLEHVRPDNLLGPFFDLLNHATVAFAGDHFNRNTAQIARDSGLRIVEVRRKLVGIVNLIVAEVVK